MSKASENLLLIGEAVDDILARHDRYCGVSQHMKAQALENLFRAIVLLKKLVREGDAFGEADGEGTP